MPGNAPSVRAGTLGVLIRSVRAPLVLGDPQHVGHPLMREGSIRPRQPTITPGDPVHGLTFSRFDHMRDLLGGRVTYY